MHFRNKTRFEVSKKHEIFNDKWLGGIHPYIAELKKYNILDNFFETTENLTGSTLPLMYIYKKRDFLFERFICEYICQFKKLRRISYYPLKTVDLSPLSECDTIVGIEVPLFSVKDLSFVLKLNNLAYIGEYGIGGVYRHSDGTLTDLKKRLKYKKNISFLSND